MNNYTLGRALAITEQPYNLWYNWYFATSASKNEACLMYGAIFTKTELIYLKYRANVIQG